MIQIKPDWTNYIQQLRRKEIDFLFSQTPKSVFNVGLEIGAGDGFQSRLLTKYINNLICTEYNPNRLLKDNTNRINYITCDAETIGNIFLNEYFDFVYSAYLLEHLPNPEKALEGTYKILNADGLAIHIVPSIFAKWCHLILHIPHRIISLMEIVSKYNSIATLIRQLLFKLKRQSSIEKYQSLDVNNPKTNRKKYPFLYYLFFPSPHGISDTNIDEFAAYKITRWVSEFEKANLHIIKIIKGPYVASGYGFGLEKTRKIFEWLGFRSSVIIIAKKKDAHSKYEQYFQNIGKK